MKQPEEKRPDIFDRIMRLPLLRMLEPFYQKHKESLLYLFFGGVTTLVSFLVFWLFEGPLGLDALLANLCTGTGDNTVSVTAGDNGTVKGASGKFFSGQSLTYTATPNSGYYFSGWSDGYSEIGALK